MDELGNAPEVPNYFRGRKIPRMDYRLSNRDDFLDLVVFMSDAGDDLLWVCDDLEKAQNCPYTNSCMTRMKQILADVTKELRKIANSLIVSDEVSVEEQVSNSDESEYSI